jgi:hypothetical protein
MIRLRHFGRLRAVTLVILAAAPLPVHAQRPQLLENSVVAVCTWQGVNSLWGSDANWSCGHAPNSTDDVVIGAAGAAPVLSSSTTVKGVSLNGNSLTVNTSAVLNVDGAFTVEGDATVTVSGAINMSLMQVTAGTLQTNGNWNGDVEVALPATLRLQANMTIPGDIVVYGTLDDRLPSNSTLFFGGTVFRNDGAVRMNTVKFSRPGAQTVVGTGEWSGVGQLRTVSGSTTTLANDLTLETELYIEGDSSFDLGDHTLTMNGASLYSMCLYSAEPSRLLGTGLLRLQGTVALDGCVEIHPNVGVITGTATVSASPAVISGTVSVLEGAALEVTTAFVTVQGNATVSGTLSGTNADSTVTFYGDQFTNDGAVGLNHLTFAGTAQTLAGSGYFVKDSTATVRNGTTLTLGCDHQMGEVWVESGGTFDIAGRKMGVSGSGLFPPLTVAGTLEADGSTITYNGVETQTLASANVHYHHLIISNTVAVKTGHGDAAITGDFTNQGNFLPEFSTVTFDGAAPQAIRGSAAAFHDLTIDNAAGVNLQTDASVKGTLTLDGDLFTGDHVLTASGTSAGAFDVFGNVRRTDLALGQARSFGNPSIALAFDAGTPPAEITITLSPSPPANLPGSVLRNYKIAATGGSGYRASLRLHYRDSELKGVTEDSLYLWRSADGLKNWRVQSRELWDQTDNWVETDGVNVFSAWALAGPGQQADVYLPVVVR